MTTKRNTKTAAKGSSKVVASKSNMILSALDVGFNTMVYFSNEMDVPESIPAAVIEGTPSITKLHNQPKIDKDQLNVEINGTTYLVGQTALNYPLMEDTQVRTRRRDRAKDWQSQILFQVGLALSCPNEDGEYDIAMVTGLPNDDYETDYHKKLEEYFENNSSFEVKFNLSTNHSITKKINVKYLWIVRQPEGTYASAQADFDAETFLTEADDADRYVGVADIGHVTTDHCVLYQSNVLDDGGGRLTDSTGGAVSVYTGLRVAIQQMMRKDYKVNNYIVTEAELDHLVRTKTLKFSGKELNLEDLVDEQVKIASTRIVRHIIERWDGNFNRIERRILSGGGAILLGEEINRILEEEGYQPFEIIPHAVEANTMGYYIFGALFLLEESGSGALKLTEKELFDTYAVPYVEMKNRIQ